MSSNANNNNLVLQRQAQVLMSAARIVALEMALYCLLKTNYLITGFYSYGPFIVVCALLGALAEEVLHRLTGIIVYPLPPDEYRALTKCFTVMSVLSSVVVFAFAIQNTQWVLGDIVSIVSVVQFLFFRRLKSYFIVVYR